MKSTSYFPFERGQGDVFFAHSDANNRYITLNPFWQPHGMHYRAPYHLFNWPFVFFIELRAFIANPITHFHDVRATHCAQEGARNRDRRCS